MDILEKFLRKISYKFPKGYPDINDAQDMLMLEGMLKEMGIDLNEVTEEDTPNLSDDIIKLKQDIQSLSKFDNLSFVREETKKKFKFYFKGIDSNRKSRLEFGKQVAQSLPQEEYKIIKTSGDEESPYFDIEAGDTTYRILIKTFGKNPFDTDTDQKEGLVVFMYNILNSGIDLKPFNKETIQSNAEILNSAASNSSLFEGLDNKVTNKVKSYINKITTSDLTTATKSNLAKLNNPFSCANEIYNSYPNKKLTRKDIFDQIRAMGSKLCQVPPDKWNPGDVYIVLDTPDFIPNDLAKLNALFVNDWGSTNSNLVSVSLKEEKAQPGRAKSYLDNLVKIKGLEGKPFNLSNEELEWDEETLKQKVRAQQEAFIKKVEGKGIDLEGNWNDLPQDIKQLRTKYGSYKLLEFLFTNSKTNDPRKDILALISFGMGLSGINPTFFKITGTDSGESANVSKFPASSTTTFNENPKFTNSPNAGGLDLDTNIAVLKGSEIIGNKKEFRKFRTAGSNQVAIV
jgi:hypothetical protein